MQDSNFDKNRSRFATAIRSNSGFTLAEILVAMAIIVIFGGIIGYSVYQYVGKARVTSTKEQIRNIESALEQFKINHGYYPDESQGIQALVSIPSSGRIPENYPEEGYLRSMPKDGWGNEFEYSIQGNKFTIISRGSDAQEGGEGENADLSNREAPANEP